MPSGSELQVLLGNVVVAQLSGDLSQPVLNWTSEWRQGGFLLAPSLPWEVNGLPPSGAAVRNFFENMLPEGTAFDHLLEYAQISRSNSIGLALHLGNDLPGAIRLRTSFFRGIPMFLGSLRRMSLMTVLAGCLLSLLMFGTVNRGSLWLACSRN